MASPKEGGGEPLGSTGPPVLLGHPWPFDPDPDGAGGQPSATAAGSGSGEGSNRPPPPDSGLEEENFASTLDMEAIKVRQFMHLGWCGAF